MEAGDFKGFLEVAHEEAKHPSRLLGMGLFWAWLQIVFASQTTELPPLILSSFPLVHHIWTISLGVTVLMFAGVLVTRPFKFLHSYTAISISHILMTLGTFGLTSSTLWGNEFSVMLFAATCIGAGSALAFLCWGWHLSHLEPRRVLFDTAVFAFLTALFYGIDAFLPSEAAAAYAIGIPLVSGGFLLHANKTLHTETPCKSAMIPESTRKTGGLLCLAVLVGLVYGIMRNTSLSFGDTTIESTTAATVVGIAVSGLLLAVTTVFYRKESELYLVCEVSFPLLAAGFLLLPQFTSGFPWPLLVFTIGHTYFYFLLWVFCVDQARTRSREPVAVFAAGLLAFLGSSLVGSLLSDALAYTGSETSGLISILSLVVVYIFVLVFAVLLGRSRADRKRAMQDESEHREALFEQCGKLVAQEAGLTPRETELFILLAKGYDRSALREEFVISNDTVKTHIRRAYSKLGIHSKQEARKLVEIRLERELRGM